MSIVKEIIWFEQNRNGQFNNWGISDGGGQIAHCSHQKSLVVHIYSHYLVYARKIFRGKGDLKPFENSGDGHKTDGITNKNSLPLLTGRFCPSVRCSLE